MFEKDTIIEFFNRIINTPDIKESDIKQNVIKFYEYLEFTKMCDEDTLDDLQKIVACINEIITIRNAMGYIDVRTLLLKDKEQPMKLTKRPRKNTSRKHYNHYEDDDYVSGCGGRPNSSTVRRSISSGCSSSGSVHVNRC